MLVEQEVGELEAPVAEHRFTAAQLEWVAEQRAGMAERVKLAALAAGVHAGGQRVEQGRIVSAAAVAGVQLPGIHAAQHRTVTFADEAPRQRNRVHAPQREYRAPVLATELTHPVVAHVFEKQVAECAMANSRPAHACPGQRPGMGFLVGFVAAGPVQRHLDQRQAERGGTESGAILEYRRASVDFRTPFIDSAYRQPL